MSTFHVLNISPLAMLMLNVCLLLLIGFGLLRTERHVGDGQHLLLLGMLALFGIAGRVLLSPLPNVQPVTFIVLLAGIHMGARRSILLATTIALGSNLIIGHGLWTLYQAIGWSLVGCMGALLSRKLESTSALLLASVFSAFLFDWVVSISILHTTGLVNLLPYLVAGVPYDLLHAATNVTLAAWLANPLADTMRRHIPLKVSLEVTEGVSTTS